MDLPFERPDSEWQHVSLIALAAWMIFYALFLLHAATKEDHFLLIDNLNLIIHEGGHFFFSWFGYTVMILGGTLAQLLVPLLVAFYFVWNRHTTGTVFAAFWFFENFLYVGAYMADARAQMLPLVGSGEHDWEILFSQWGLLARDTAIGGFVRGLGWAGMLGTLAWFVWMASRRTAHPECASHQ